MTKKNEWGCLKFCRKSDLFSKRKVLLDRLEKVSSSSSPEMINAVFQEMLDIAGTYSYKSASDWNDSLNMNVSLCWLDHSFLDIEIRNELRKIASLQVKYPSHYGMGTDPASRRFMPQNEEIYTINANVYMPFEYRLLALFRYWNIIYYFFPHKYLMDQSWDITLNEFIFPFIESTDKQSYQITFLKLFASLNDGHAYSNLSTLYSHESIGLVEKIEGKTIVRIDGGGLYKGDIINRIGKRDINHIRDSLSVLIPASTKGNKEHRINCYVAEMIFFNETDVTVSRDGQELDVHILPIVFKKQHSNSYERLSGDIGYVNLSALITEEMDNMFQSFSDAKGIIFDLRKMGSYNYDVSLYECHLSDQATILPSTIVWDLERPGAYYWIESRQTIRSDNKQCPPFNGRLIYLVDENTQSFTETQAWVARVNYEATLIGRTTSGAWGQVVWIPLPGGINVAFSGVGLFSLDGTELQRKGLIPDIEVYPTMDDVMAGRDEVLEAAIAYLNSMGYSTQK
jgi:hypothetical protein